MKRRLPFLLVLVAILCVAMIPLSTSSVAASTVAVNGDSSGNLRCYARSSNVYYHKCSKSWFPVGIWEADAYSPGTCEALVDIGCVGQGSAKAEAWVGQTLTVTGGDAWCDINMYGYLDGNIVTIPGGSASWTLYIGWKNVTHNTISWQEIDGDSRSGIAAVGYYRDFATNRQVLLENNHTYQVLLRIVCKASCTGTGLASADFGGDGGNFVWYHYFDVSW